MRRTDRRSFLGTTGLAGVALLGGRGWSWAAETPRFEFKPGENVIPAPADPTDWPAFRQALQGWRARTREALAYRDDLYRRGEFAWAATCYSCCFLMVCDETFYDPRAGVYRVREFLASGRREFGGYDAVVLWHAYPRIGADERNQFDFYRDLPGGLAGLRRAVRQFRASGTRVFIDYNPWDRGTRREGADDLEALAGLVGAIEADGIFLDTMDRGAAGFRARLDAVRPGVVLEGEGALPVDRIHDHHLSWAQWFADSAVPGVLRNKWFERRHLQHQIKRWDHDHSGEIQCAWMNGSGMMVWENVFGSWVGWNERDRSLLRALLPVQRRYASLFDGEGWTPLVPTRAPTVFASLWEAGGLRLWTLANRSNQPVDGDLIEIALGPGEAVYDLLAGRRVAAGWVAAPGAGTVVVAGRIPARGLGGFLAGASPRLGPGFGAFLRRQRARATRDRWETAFPAIPTRLRAVARTRPYARPPDGTAAIPGGAFELVTQFRERECGFYESVPPEGHRLASSYEPKLGVFKRPASLAPYAIDLEPVTNERFARFLRATAYRPRHPENFLRHWPGGVLPAALADHPVVYVDLDDARAYARWAGRRLPTEEEWQFAAQGPAALAYPWGPDIAPGRCNDGTSGGTTPVRAFPAGRSPFGVWDLCGNVWEWTESERTDGRTRFCLLKGGSFYRARGSNWYFDGGPQPNGFVAKFLLMWPGLDRCATIGFRCVADLAPKGGAGAGDRPTGA